MNLDPDDEGRSGADVARHPWLYGRSELVGQVEGRRNDDPREDSDEKRHLPRR